MFNLFVQFVFNLFSKCSICFQFFFKKKIQNIFFKTFQKTFQKKFQKKLLKTYKKKFKNVLKKNNKGKIIISKLFQYISKKPNKFINNDLLKHDKYRAVADFISGMTDRYAINIYDSVK